MMLLNFMQQITYESRQKVIPRPPQIKSAGAIRSLEEALTTIKEVGDFLRKLEELGLIEKPRYKLALAYQKQIRAY